MSHVRMLHRLPGLALVVGLLGLLYGCGSSSLDAPPPPNTSLLRLPESDPPAFVRTPNVPPPSPMFAGATPTVVNPIVIVDTLVLEIGRQLVPPDTDTDVRGGRCLMQFHVGAISSPTEVTIGYWDADVLAFDFGPEGTEFRNPVQLCVDLSGTNVDPSSPNFDGTKPKFFWLNKPGGVWEEVPGAFDQGSLLFKVELHHFSTYAVGSKAGW